MDNCQREATSKAKGTLTVSILGSLEGPEWENPEVEMVEETQDRIKTMKNSISEEMKNIPWVLKII